MNKKLALQITQIENGFLIQTPGQTMVDRRTGEQVQSAGEVYFAMDYDSVCEVLKKFWPSTLIT